MCMSDVFVHVCVYRSVYMSVWMCVAWLSEVDLGCLPQLLSTVWGGINAQAHTWSTEDNLQFCFCFCFSFYHMGHVVKIELLALAVSLFATEPPQWLLFFERESH